MSSDLQSIIAKISRLRRAKGQLDYPFQNAPPRQRATSGTYPLVPGVRLREIHMLWVGTFDLLVWIQDVEYGCGWNRSCCSLFLSLSRCQAVPDDDEHSVAQLEGCSV